MGSSGLGRPIGLREQHFRGWLDESQRRLLGHTPATQRRVALVAALGKSGG